jgi:hypothetical protein
VTGVLARTDTPVDRGVFVNREGFYLLEGHAKPVEGDEESGKRNVESGERADGSRDDGNQGPVPLPFAQREVTALLVETAALPGLPGMPDQPAELTAMNAVWAAAPSVGDPARVSALPMERLEQVYRAMSYVARWTGQIQERVVQLAV